MVLGDFSTESLLVVDVVLDCRVDLDHSSFFWPELEPYLLILFSFLNELFDNSLVVLRPFYSLVLLLVFNSFESFGDF